MLPQLETKRLVLREVTPDDARTLQVWQSRPEQWRQQAMEPDEMSDSAARIAGYLAHHGPDHERRLFVYVAVAKDTGRLVGQVSLQRSHPAIAHLGFGVAHDRTGQGLASEMGQRLIAFGFEEVGLNRLACDIAVENAASRRIAEKLGMVLEGVSRACIFAQGRWWDEAQYAILSAEYEVLRTAA